ncbi:MAG: TetR/AcrR family transcriptional regulator [Clostridia bacterium]|nr:TetR/AcrR family transcriptional regulator [Clostridia bacterium]
MVLAKIETRQSRKRNATHISIMHNAKKLFEEKGLGKVTIEEITEAADISRSTFFAHFDSVDALVAEIADIAVRDILDEYVKRGKNGREGILALMDKLIEDTCPYPYLTVELFLNGIVKSRGKTPFSELESLICKELTNAGVNEARYSHKEQSALVMGAYFGTVFQKFIRRESLWEAEEIKHIVKNLLNNIIGE